MSARPTFLHIGPSKAGSTWIFKVLSWHPQIYAYPGKNLGFFSNHFEGGWDWYCGHFDPDPQHIAIGEVSHSYLASPDACDRIHQLLPDAKLMVCLREPVQRIFSDYLDAIKNGKLQGTLEQEVERTPALVDRSRYGTNLGRYLEKFDRDQIHIASFDELSGDPARFAARMFEFLGVDRLEIPPSMWQKVLPAGVPRSRAVASAAKRLSKAASRMGLAGVRGKIKTSNTVRALLYRPYEDAARPTMAAATEAKLRHIMSEEIRLLDTLADTDFSSLWAYSGAQRDGIVGA